MKKPPPAPAGAFALYGQGEPEVLQAYDTSHGERDLRYVYLLRCPDGTKIALKAARNAFTTPERVEGWAALTEHYNALGIYAPRFLKTAQGQYTAGVGGFLVYAEEYIDGVMAEAQEETSAGKPDFRKSEAGVAMLETLGLAAANPAPLVPWSTSWCLYDRFDDDDQTDENSECATKLTAHIAENFPQYALRAQAVLAKYFQLRAEFEPIYRALPKAVFQGDLGPNNVVLDHNGAFKGVCDFNLSGTEPVLNMLLCECRACWNGTENEKFALFAEPGAQRAQDELTARFLRHATRHYKLTDAEKRAFNTLYNITYAFRWQNYGFLKYHLGKQGKRRAPVILEWIERQMARDDAWQMLP
ncbi:MAG: phosphotransferase [Firmicutes bacterium]|nr:phosphotransferase [Bacillota bacterium]